MAELERLDRGGQPLGHGQHRPVRVGGLPVAQRIEARADLVGGDARVRGVSSGSIAHEEMQRRRRDEAARPGVEQSNARR